MENGLSQWVELIAAVHASITLTTSNLVEFSINDAAPRTILHMTVALTKNELQAGIVIWEVSPELFCSIPSAMLHE